MKDLNEFGARILVEALKNCSEQTVAEFEGELKKKREQRGL